MMVKFTDHEVPIESATPQKVAHAIAAFARRVIEVKRATVVAAKEEAARERERRAELAKVKSEANPLKQRIWVPQLIISLMLLWALACGGSLCGGGLRQELVGASANDLG
jgi:hypothetical protein